MIISITKKDIIWSYAAQIFHFGSGIIILPVILKKLSSAELAIWYAFMSINSLVMLLEYGFSPTISRNISYVFSGAKKLLPQGIEKISSATNEIDYNLLFHLIRASKRIYVYISLISFLIMLLFTFYLTNINKTIERNELYISWIIFILSSILSFYFGYFIPILNGQGKIKETKKTIVFSRVIFIITSYLLLINGLGLTGISIANFIYSASIRIFSYYYYSDKKIKDKKNFYNNALEKQLIEALWNSSYKLGLVSFGSFLILKINYMLSAKYLGLEISASYGLTQQLFEFLVSSCTILSNVLIPSFSKDRINGDLQGIARKYGMSLIIACFIYLSGMIIIISFGNNALQLISSKTLLLPTNILLFYSLICFLEFNHSIAATIITTKNEIPFLKPALISGLLITFFSFLSIKFTSIGIVGLLFSQFIIQLLYNNWKWPYVLCKDIGYNFIEIWLLGIKSILMKIKSYLYE